MMNASTLLQTPVGVAITATLFGLLVLFRIISTIIQRCSAAEARQEKKVEKESVNRRRILVESSLHTTIFGSTGELSVAEDKPKPASPISRKALASLLFLSTGCEIKNKANDGAVKVEVNDTEHTGKLSSSPEDDESGSGYDEDQLTCSICLCDYEHGQEVCRSQNGLCNHKFHKACVFEWLLKHDDCPCCRRNIISSEKGATEGSPSRGDVFVSERNEGEVIINETDVEAGPP
mmetsp:Transcript_29625/g.60492  ORF Transcript_29625/g.60492 Transcript_29625/m.60492 type:complete len:234 (-) Transcript_29625:337-1038(-)